MLLLKYLKIVFLVLYLSYSGMAKDCFKDFSKAGTFIADKFKAKINKIMDYYKLEFIKSEITRFIPKAKDNMESCTYHDIPGDITKLKMSLQQKIFGQDLAQEVVFNAISEHWNQDNIPKDPLVFSFHGMPGTGKTHMVHMIVESLYRKGFESNHVHHFVGRLDFPINSVTKKHSQEDILNWIKSNVTSCSRQLFIFDEADHMSAKSLVEIRDFLIYNNLHRNYTLDRAIFIFISNTGYQNINRFAIEFAANGNKRENLQFDDFHSAIPAGAFDEEGVPSSTNQVVDYYVPFLPLELHHVRQCVLEEFHKRNLKVPKEKYLRLLSQYLEWVPKQMPIFSKTGCKTISQRAGSMIEQYYEYLI